MGSQGCVQDFMSKSPERCNALTKALQSDNFNDLYSVIQTYFEDGYSAYCPQFQVQGAAILKGEWGTVGLCYPDNPDKGSPTYNLSLELSRSFYLCNLWWEVMSDACGEFDEESEIQWHKELDIERLVQERLAEQLKKEAPECRVFILLAEKEILLDKNGNPYSVHITKQEMPPSRCAIPEFLYEFNGTNQVDGRHVDVYTPLPQKEL